MRSEIVRLIEPAQRAFDEAITSASDYPELAEEVRSLEARMTNRFQLELFDDLKRQKRVRSLDVVQAALRAADRALINAKEQSRSAFNAFLARIRSFRVLDPACGSGNFLYLALQALKDIEHRAGIEAEALGLPREFPRVDPEQLLGIEINPYAAELARVSVWIGEIQWMQRNGFGIPKNPILRPLNTIECRDAILNPDGSEATWPVTDAIIGNPPFLGSRKMWNVVGRPYADTLRRQYEGRVPVGADLVTYWFSKTSEALARGEAQSSGLVATNSIRGGSSRLVLDQIARRHRIFNVWADEAWVVDGAAVRVSLICFTANNDTGKYPIMLNGQPVDRILTDLTPATLNSTLDLTCARPLCSNINVAWQGVVPRGAFQVSGERARAMLAQPLNPNGEPNAAVLRPYLNAADLTRRPRDTWLVDFDDLSEQQASLFELPFLEIEKVREARKSAEQKEAREQWWKLWRPRKQLREQLSQIQRYLAVPRIGKYQPFSWRDARFVPDNAIVVVARDDDVSFGILNSRVHQLWCGAVDKSSLEDRPRYTVSVKFDTFPFPDRLTPDIPATVYAGDPQAQRIAAVAMRLHELREAWLNPPDLVARIPEVVSAFPERIISRDEAAAKELRNRTLTKLYNQRPAWLDIIHKELDAAVLAAYGWPADLPDDEILKRLFELNQARASIG